MNNITLTVGYGKVKPVIIGKNQPLVFIGGPCAIEGRDHSFYMAEKIGNICSKLNIPWIFKSCYDKDCRSAPDSFHGLGVDHGLRILSEIRDTGVPVSLIFPIHHGQVQQKHGQVQVPFLCRKLQFKSS